MDVKDKQLNTRIANLLESILKGRTYEIEHEFRKYLESLIKFEKLKITPQLNLRYRGWGITNIESDNSRNQWHNRNLNFGTINNLIKFQLELFVKLVQEKQIEIPDMILLSCVAIDIVHPDDNIQVTSGKFDENKINELPLEIRKKLNFYNHKKEEVKSENKH